MRTDELFSIIDFGSYKFRIGIFANYLPNSKFISEITYLQNTENIIYQENQLKKIIVKTEKEIGKHLKNINVMIDDKDCISLDLSIKKHIDKNKLNKNLIKTFIQEAKLLIENNYLNYKIQHLIINKYILDEVVFYELPNDSISNELVLEIKFLLIPKSIILNVQKTLKKNHIIVDNFFNTSYIKSLNYNKYYEEYKSKVFLDIGLNKTSIFFYNSNNLIYSKFIPIGGNHVTKDISKLLNYDLQESENIKLQLKQNNLTFLNDESSKDLLIKIVHARIEEIIDLSFKDFDYISLIKNTKSILVFSGEGSKLLSKKSIYLKEEYNHFDDMSFFEENSSLICDSAFNYDRSDISNEVVIVPKRQQKTGLFEKLFYLFSN